MPSSRAWPTRTSPRERMQDGVLRSNSPASHSPLARFRKRIFLGTTLLQVPDNSSRMSVTAARGRPDRGRLRAFREAVPTPRGLHKCQVPAHTLLPKLIENLGLVATLSLDLPLAPLRHEPSTASPPRSHFTMTGSVEKASVPINRNAIAETSVSAVQSNAPRLPVRAGNR